MPLRRRVLRPQRRPPVTASTGASNGTQLEKERAAAGPLDVRLKRAFHAVERQQQRIRRLERQLRPTAAE